MKRYKALNESEFHRMISEATMGVVRRFLQEVNSLRGMPEDDYYCPEDDCRYPRPRH